MLYLIVFLAGFFIALLSFTAIDQAIKSLAHTLFFILRTLLKVFNRYCIIRWYLCKRYNVAKYNKVFNKNETI